MSTSPSYQPEKNPCVETPAKPPHTVHNRTRADSLSAVDHIDWSAFPGGEDDDLFIFPFDIDLTKVEPLPSALQFCQGLDEPQFQMHQAVEYQPTQDDVPRRCIIANVLVTESKLIFYDIAFDNHCMMIDVPQFHIWPIS